MSHLPLVIENIHLVTPNAVLEHASIAISDGKIAAIGENLSREGAECIDANGGYALPGLIDLHSDALEKAIAVRPSAPFPADIALMEFDKTLVGCGITSMFYCVGYMESNPLSAQRSIEEAQQQSELITRYNQSLMTNSYVHARVDLPSPASIPSVLEAMESGNVHMVSLNDHTPGQGQYGDINEFLEMTKKRFTDNNLNEENLKILLDRHNAIDYDKVRELVDVAVKQGIPVASHDDDSAEQVQEREKWGVSIAEFPINEAAVTAANDLNVPVVLGSPNVLRGKSHSGNISARDAVSNGQVDCICSDYSPMSMLQSLFCLHDLKIAPLNDLVNLYTLGPAKAAGLGDHTGSLEVGKDADMILVRPGKPTARLEMTFVKGRQVLSHFGEWEKVA
jgi:alpha-D-ribose 1-methylphosphonate 5-triphosphate diphosphatase